MPGWWGEKVIRTRPSSRSGDGYLSGAAGADCTYVADNPGKDFAGPRSRGWRTVRVRRRLSLHEAIASGPDVDLELADLSDLATMLTT